VEDEEAEDEEEEVVVVEEKDPNLGRLFPPNKVLGNI
jgi:hypothetical protein